MTFKKRKLIRKRKLLRRSQRINKLVETTGKTFKRHPYKNTPLSWVSKLSEVHRKFGVKIMEIKVAKINAILNQRRGN